MKVLLVDDHEEVRVMLRVGLRLNPRVEIVGEAASATDAAVIAGRLQPDAIVLDLRLPDAAGQQAFRLVRAAAPESRVAIYSARESSRPWYERQGVPFFGKSTDNVEAVLAWIRTAESPD